MFNKLKQFKDLKDQAKILKDMLAKETAEGSGAWGKVKIIMNGNQEVQSVTVDPEFLALDKKEKLEQGIKEATNDAIKKVQRVMAEKIQSMGKMPF